MKSNKINQLDFLKNIPYGYGFPAIYDNKGSIYIRVNEQELKEITSELNYKFDFASLFTKYYCFILFETEFITEANLTCLSQTFFYLERKNHQKILRIILKQGYINFIFFNEIYDEGMSYTIELTNSQRNHLEKMIRMVKIGIKSIPEERKDTIKALKILKERKACKIKFKDFLENPEIAEEKYREFLKKNN